MSLFKTVALGLAVIIVSSASVEAATRHRKATHHTTHHAARHSASTHSSARATMPRGSATSSDNSADALNARSLARTQGATP